MTKKTIISAFYDEGHPFNTLNCVGRTIASVNPKDLTEDSILLLHGGGDISPKLYNKPLSYWGGGDEEPPYRDRIEWAMMQRAKELGIPIIGICRGAQILCAFAGGHLIQHVNNHGYNHRVRTKDNHTFMVNSAHHQMMWPFAVEHVMWAWAEDHVSNVWMDIDDTGNEVQNKPAVEPEMVFFPKINGWAIQWHPEWLKLETECNKYVLETLNERLRWKEKVNA